MQAPEIRTGELVRRGWAPAILDRPVRAWWLVAWWAVATGIFVMLLFVVSGGPSSADFADSEYATVAIAHGDFSCSYSSANPTPTPPLYPLVAGAVMAVTGIGGRTGIPGLATDRTCLAVFGSIERSEVADGQRVIQVGWVGMVGWIALLAGFVALLRAIGRGRRGWEAAGVLALAIIPACSECIDGYLHPNDLLALGLALGGLAACLTKRWGLAGVLIGLGMTSHQFVLLVAVPLVILIPRSGRWRFIATTVLASAAVIVPFSLVTRGAAFASQAGQSAISPVARGTWVDLLHLTGAPQVAVARGLPLVFSAGLALWALRRDGDVWSPRALLSIMCISLGFRLVFETQLFGYYMLATTVMLVVVDWAFGRFRYGVLAWIAAVSFLFQTVGFGRPIVAPVTLHQPVPVQLIVLVAFFALTIGPLLEVLPQRKASPSTSTSQPAMV